jgi:ubiquinone/menaquinone biosynthesis C-methylase UbiE
LSVGNYYEKYWTEAGFNPKNATWPELARIYAANINSGFECIDVGCGDGNVSGRWLTAHGCKYIGVDISQQAIKQAESNGFNARQIGDASDLPFEESSFDAAVCIEVIEHLFQPLDAMIEIHRVLRTGGVLVVTTPNIAYWRRRVDLAVLGRWNPLGDMLSVDQPWRDPHIRFFNPGVLRRMLRAAGFQDVRVGAHGGTVVGDLPWIGKRMHGLPRIGAYRAAERVAPALFGYRLHGIAKKARS